MGVQRGECLYGESKRSVLPQFTGGIRGFGGDVGGIVTVGGYLGVLHTLV